ncbi:hypothetical protein C5Y97_28045 [Blastopirellula marina]|uniref:Uncharacterized protein n=1 Tax=Blastopirellula marina TaxID=124 RepID=A0A2S8F4K9_9BACT|nr:hypothetical protein C5Y98_28030 [Blastopirellula marina]PTL41249.1 hypothetical protein C5Y97_28045 [Blastopirellula marina]
MVQNRDQACQPAPASQRLNYPIDKNFSFWQGVFGMRSFLSSRSTAGNWRGLGMRAMANIVERTFRLTSRNPVEASLVLVLSMAMTLVASAWL